MKKSETRVAGGNMTGMASGAATADPKRAVRIKARLKYGWTEDEAAGKVTVADHMGNQFATTKEMCVYWNIDFEGFCKRIANGWSLERALTEPTEHSVQDHLGRSYASIQAMAKAYEMDPCTLRYRLRTGWNLESALTAPVNTCSNRAAADHTGRVFSNISEMCNYWGIGRDLYDRRRRMGYTLEEILTTPVSVPKPATDHEGTTYASTRQMCKAWGIAERTYTTRRRRGLSVEEALTEPVAPRLYRSTLKYDTK